MKRTLATALALALAIPATPTSTAVADEWRCGEWRDAAIEAGWSEDEWPILDKIIWRESRCKPDVYNGRGRDKSYGLLQLNMRAHRAWVSPIVGGDFTALWTPEINLAVGRVLFEKAEDMYGCGWKPWVTRKTRGWCRRG